MDGWLFRQLRFTELLACPITPQRRLRLMCDMSCDCAHIIRLYVNVCGTTSYVIIGGEDYYTGLTMLHV
jgi:hypothetical protein